MLVELRDQVGLGLRNEQDVPALLYSPLQLHLVAVVAGCDFNYAFHLRAFYHFGPDIGPQVAAAREIHILRLVARFLPVARIGGCVRRK